MRNRPHEIDTLARRRVINSFPDSWEHHEMTGRDYGIDILAEIFCSGLPKGNIIAIQLKGTEKSISEGFSISLPVSTLKYAEIFQSPVFLMVCSINDPGSLVYYIWLQEYISVILDFDNPNWRRNQKTVTLSIPLENVVQNNINKIEYIAEQPQRLRDFCQLARICSDLEYELEEFIISDDFLEEDYNDIISFRTNRKKVEVLLSSIELKLQEVLNLRSIINLSNETIKPIIDSALDAISKLRANQDNGSRPTLKRYINRVSLINPLMAVLGMYNDAKLSRISWEHDKTHLF